MLNIFDINRNGIDSDFEDKKTLSKGEFYLPPEKKFS